MSGSQTFPGLMLIVLIPPYSDSFHLSRWLCHFCSNLKGKREHNQIGFRWNSKAKETFEKSDFKWKLRDRRRGNLRDYVTWAHAQWGPVGTNINFLSCSTTTCLLSSYMFWFSAIITIEPITRSRYAERSFRLPLFWNSWNVLKMTMVQTYEIRYSNL